MRSALLLALFCAVLVGCECQVDSPLAETVMDNEMAPAPLRPPAGANASARELPPEDSSVINASSLAAVGLDYDFAGDEDGYAAAVLLAPMADRGPECQTLAAAAVVARTRLEVIAHNLANAQTPAFKRRHVDLADAAYEHRQLPGAEDSMGQLTSCGVSIGGGVRVAAVRTDFSQGRITTGGRPLDVAIEGEGFFGVADPSGAILYTRAGSFSMNANGDLAICTGGIGRLLDPPITIPEDATAVSIGPEGLVSVQQAGCTSFTQLGTIQLARFVNPEGLLPQGDNLYAESPASGPATIGNPGTLGLGVLRQNALEMSNVDSKAELREWAQTQRLLRFYERAALGRD